MLDRVKIGKTRNLAARFGDLQRSGPDQLFCVATVEGYTHVERWFHRRFQHTRIHGEWFIVDKALATMIRRIQVGGCKASQWLCPKELALDRSAQLSFCPDYADKIRESYDQGETLTSILKRHPRIDPGTLKKIVRRAPDAKVGPRLLKIGVTDFIRLMRRVKGAS